MLTSFLTQQVSVHGTHGSGSEQLNRDFHYAAEHVAVIRAGERGILMHTMFLSCSMNAA